MISGLETRCLPLVQWSLVLVRSASEYLERTSGVKQDNDVVSRHVSAVVEHVVHCHDRLDSFAQPLEVWAHKRMGPRTSPAVPCRCHI
eukprot:6161500-Amphidinium_carterae.1